MIRMYRTAMMMTPLFALLLGGVMLVTQVRAAEKPKDAANDKTPELCVRPAKQQGQFDLELRLPGKGSNPRMTVEAGKWGMLEVALDAATQLSFRARIDADKQQVRVSGQVTVAVAGGFQQSIVDDEPWPVGEWTALKEQATSQPTAQEPPGAVRLDVFAKIIVPSKGGGAAGPHGVEPWIAKELSTRGVPIPRAVTSWIRLPEGDANDVAHLWDGNLDGKTYGCPASGCVGKRTGESVTVDLNGFGPVAPEIQGATVPPRRGARGIAVVNDGQAFVALHVAPIGEAATTQLAADTDWGEAVGGLQTRLTAEQAQVKAGEPVRLKLELRNVGAEVRRVDAQQVAVNDPLIVRGPKGEEIPFVAGQVSTLGETRSIKPGETVVLFDGLDAAGQYPLTAPGVHTFQFRGRKAIAFLGEGETSIPPSNTIRVELTGEPPATAPAKRTSSAAGAVR
jgi:hypothetical protein